MTCPLSLAVAGASEFNRRYPTFGLGRGALEIRRDPLTGRFVAGPSRTFSVTFSLSHKEEPMMSTAVPLPGEERSAAMHAFDLILNLDSSRLTRALLHLEEHELGRLIAVLETAADG